MIRLRSTPQTGFGLVDRGQFFFLNKVCVTASSLFLIHVILVRLVGSRSPAETHDFW